MNNHVRAALAIVGVGLFVLGGTGSLPADDVRLTAQAPLKTPKKMSDSRAREPYDAARYEVWLPGATPVVRGLIVNPFHLGAVDQEHWQAAARQWGFGIVAGDLFGVRADDFETLGVALARLAEDAQRPELAHAPLVFVGMSAGAGMSMQFTALLPERTLAAGPVCLEVGPRDDASRRVPIITVFGERDGRQYELLRGKLPVERAAGAQWAIAVQWGRRHEFARANNLLFPLVDRALALRYPADATPARGPVALRTLDEADGWLADVSQWPTSAPTIAPYAEFAGDKSQACWLPDAYTAAVWRASVAAAPQPRIVRPAGLGDGQPFVVHRQGAAGDEPFVQFERRGSPHAAALELVVLYDGDREVARSDGREQAFAWRPDRAGIVSLIVEHRYADGRREFSPPNTIVVVGD